MRRMADLEYIVAEQKVHIEQLDATVTDLKLKLVERVTEFTKSSACDDKRAEMHSNYHQEQ